MIDSFVISTIRAFVVGQIIAIAFSLFLLPSNAWIHGSAAIAVPTADIVCTVTTGNCTGTGGGSALFTAATCNGVADDAIAFISFNSFIVNTWQVAHPGLLPQLSIPTGKVCEFISGDVNNNLIGQGLKRFQVVGYGATLADANGAGGGFALGAGGLFFDNLHSARFATIAAGAISITLLDTSKCGLYNNGDESLLGGIDPIGFGDPASPQIYEYIQINSVAACAGSGVITLKTPTQFGYKSTWPLYNSGDAFHSDLGGPATIYALNQNWVTNQAFYGLTIDQRSNLTNANGQFIAFYDLSVPIANTFCPIPSQNQSWSVTNGTMPGCTMEVDKIVVSASLTNVTIRRLLFQSGADPQHFSCASCNVTFAVTGTAGISTYTGGSIADLLVGASAYGAAGSFSGIGTVISSIETGGAGLNKIDVRGVWAGGTFTVPANMSISAAANNGSGLIRLTVGSSAGWSTGIVGDAPGGNCSGTFPVTVIDATHVDLQGSAFTGTCTGSFGSLPLTWAIPRANVYFSGGQAPLGPILQVADLAVGANNTTVVSFSQNGSPYAGGFPVMPGTAGAFTVTDHPAPSWSCLGCTGAQAVLDITGAAASGLAYGSYASRVLTAANSNTTAMNTFGALTELDITVTAACSGTANVAFAQSMFYETLGSATLGVWNPTVNGLTASATPRVITPTSSSGAQSGDSLATPGSGTWLLSTQTIPLFSNVGNCGSAATTITAKTNQGVVYP